MGLVTSLVRVDRRASVEGPLPLTSERILAWMGGEATATGVVVTPEGSLKLAAVWSCVRTISEDLASLPLLTYTRVDRGKARAPTHPLYRLLHDEPNPWMTSMQLRETMQGHVLLRGNAYASIERDQDGRPVELWPLRPDRMDAPILSEAGTLLYTYHLPSGEPRGLTQSEVLHIRGLSTDGIVGYSPITLHREALGLSLATQTYGSRFFGNDSRPGGVLQSPKKLTLDAAKRMKESWEAAHKGLGNAHRVAVLEEGVEWKQVGMSNEDSQFLDTRLFQIQEVGRIFRMPPHKMQELSRATYSNIEEQSIEYVSDCLRPWLVRWEQQINKDLVMPGEKGRVFVEHLMDALLRGKTLERFQAYQLGLQNGVWSANEVREFENANPFAGGDVHLQMQNMAPYGAMPEPAAAPAAAPSRSIRAIRRTNDGFEVEDREATDGQQRVSA